MHKYTQHWGFPGDTSDREHTCQRRRFKSAFKDGTRLSNVRKSQVLPTKTKTKNMQITKTSYSLMHKTGIINSLLISSKILSAFVFGLFVQSADPCRLCGIFLSEALKFLTLKTKLSPTEREF